MSLISVMRMGTPTRPRCALSPLSGLGPVAGLLTGIALTSSLSSHWQWLGACVAVLSAWHAWRSHRRLSHALHAAHGRVDVWHNWLEGCQDAVMVLERRQDPMGHVIGHVVTQANARAHALFSPGGPPLVHQLLRDVLPAGLHPSFEQRLHQAWDSGRPEVDEHVLPVRDAPDDGDAPALPRWLSHQMIPLPHGVVLISRETSEVHRSLTALREQEAFYRSLVDSLPMAVFARSTRAHNAGRYVVWNRQAACTMQLGADEVLGRRPEEVLPGHLVERGLAQDQAVVQEPRVHQFNGLIYRTPGGERLVDLIKAPVYGVDGQLDHILSIALDVTEQRQAAERLRLASRVIDETADAVVVSDAQDRVLMANPAFLRLSGLRREEVIGQHAPGLGLAPLDEPHLAGIREALDTGQRWSGECPLAGPGGRLLETWLSVIVLPGDAPQFTQHIRVFNDISTLKAQQRELADQARRDSLTGLPNRRVFAERLRQAMSRARRHPQTLAVMYVDLDGFKAINDRLGHAAGDRLLIEVANRLEACVRTTDCVCRLAGDEFTIILEGAGHPEEVCRIAQRILDQLGAPCPIGEHTVQPAASLGAALFDVHEGLEVLCQRADAAMYEAKHGGKGRFVLAETPQTDRT
ncbi:MAG: diguanylate cyclase [Proteobacteria bacterium]|uniref:diguanylate cyclase domain-containing protein n=1 Tax=Aquabacterium sp. TaxID=1872578 RepID=UPI0035C6D8C3|nr:diguanylate cyclase [Pseudomonadota bacterium]